MRPVYTRPVTRKLLEVLSRWWKLLLGGAAVVILTGLMLYPTGPTGLMLYSVVTPSHVNQSSSAAHENHRDMVIRHENHRDMGQTLLTMAWATNYRGDVLQPFINSYQRWTNRSADMVVFVDVGFKPSELALQRPENVRWVVTDEVEVPGMSREQLDAFAIPALRFIVMKAWLARHGEGYQVVAVVDSRDSFFQDDPFMRVSPSEPALYAFPEGVKLAQEPNYNQKWIRLRYGEAKLQQLIAKDASVLCAGFVMATRKEFVGWIEALLHEMTEWTDGVDQAAHIWLAYMVLPEQFPVVIVSHRTGWVTHAPEEYNPSHPRAHPNTHLAPMSYLSQDSMGRVLNARGQPYAVVHQGDRFPAIWSTFQAMYPFFPPNPHPFTDYHHAIG